MAVRSSAAFSRELYQITLPTREDYVHHESYPKLQLLIVHVPSLIAKIILISRQARLKKISKSLNHLHLIYPRPNFFRAQTFSSSFYHCSSSNAARLPISKCVSVQSPQIRAARCHGFLLTCCFMRRLVLGLDLLYARRSSCRREISLPNTYGMLFS
jgi:hypothetical protein